MTRWQGRLIVLVMVAASAACAPAPPVAPAERTARHVLVVTIDTLRADRIGVYGNATVATPNFDRLAREGAMALHASAHAPLTRPSHISLFTGLYPAEHGIRDNVSPPLGKTVPVLAEILQQRGFRTGAFVSSIVLSKQSGLGRGFAHYSDQFEVGEDDARFLNTIQKRGDATVAEAVAWLGESGPERRFGWVHLYDPHDPYEPPEPYASRYAGRPYDGEVAWSDELVGRLDTALGAAGLPDMPPLGNDDAAFLRALADSFSVEDAEAINLAHEPVMAGIRLFQTDQDGIETVKDKVHLLIDPGIHRGECLARFVVHIHVLL